MHEKFDVAGQSLGIVGSAAVAGVVAIGLAISFRLMGVINLAHGAFLTVGAYAGVMAERDLGAPWAVAVAIAFCVGGLLGAGTEVVLIRRVYRSPALSILATFGLAVVLREVIVINQGANYAEFTNPRPGASHIFGTVYPTYRLILIVFASVVLAAVIAALNLTRLGVRVQAVAADRALAETVGVRASRLNLLVFATSTALASLAGVLVAPLATVGPDLGQDYLLSAFVIVIVGGTSIAGVLVASLLVSAVNNLVAFQWNPVTGQLATLGLALISIQWFRRSRTREVL